MLEILNNIRNEGGSGTGCSYYSQVLRCPRRAHLDKKAQEDAERENLPPSDAAAVGIAFHKLMEVYYGGAEKEALAIEDSDVPSSSPGAEALRLFRFYTRHFKPDFWGNIVGAEVGLENDFFGVPWTGRVDLAIEVTDESLPRVRALGLDVTPGVYLLDFKTMKQKNSMAQELYSASLQFNAYQMAWEHEKGVKPQGMIAQCIIAHKVLTKDKSLGHYLIQFPDERKQRGVRDQLEMAKALDATDSPFWTDCFSFHRPCPYLDVECDRTCKGEE